MESLLKLLGVLCVNLIITTRLVPSLDERRNASIEQLLCQGIRRLSVLQEVSNLWDDLLDDVSKASLAERDA